jgi:SAM-dependent methyltransferase
MYGTFNLETSLNLKSLPPARTDYAGYHKFWLVKLENAYYGWAMRWEDSRMPDHRLEIISKKPFPNSLKEGRIKIEVLTRMTDKEIKAWAEQIHFFQTFEWTPAENRAANSGLIWEAISACGNFQNKTVLDIGANFGYHAFQASKAGALVIGYDQNKNVIPVAKLINDRIEMQDVTFTAKPLPPEPFDFIFYLSVHHQFDPQYKRLEQTLADLKTRAREAVFVELINPPLKGRATEAEIDKMIRGKKLVHYAHEVRKTRTLYVRGEA